MSERDLLIELNLKASARLDQALLKSLKPDYPALSRNQLKRLFEEKRIFLNEISRPAAFSLTAGTHSIRIEDAHRALTESVATAHPSTRGCFLPVLYEDENLLVFDKSSGTPSLPHSPQETETAVGAALAHFPRLSGVGRGGFEPGLLHRLDTGTSGVLVFAKNQAEFDRLSFIWKQGGVSKIYRAIVHGDFSQSHLARKLPAPLELSLAHHPKSSKRMIVVSDSKQDFRGKPLPTRTKISALHTSSQQRSDLEIEIETGVMHQIRCTLAHLGFPIVGDPVYTPAALTGEHPRLLLHAWKLEIPSAEGKRIEIVAPLPAEFQI